MCRQATLALTTCLGACLGVNRRQLKRLFGAWGVTLSFRRERFSFLDFNFVAAESLPSRKPCKLSGPLLDELVLVSVLAPLYLPDLRSHRLSELFAFDAFDSRAGGCGAAVREDQWWSLYDLSEEWREHVRCDWESHHLILRSLIRGQEQLGTPCLFRETLLLVRVQGSQAHQPPRDRERSVTLAASRL